MASKGGAATSGPANRQETHINTGKKTRCIASGNSTPLPDEVKLRGQHIFRKRDGLPTWDPPGFVACEDGLGNSAHQAEIFLRTRCRPAEHVRAGGRSDSAGAGGPGLEIG